MTMFSHPHPQSSRINIGIAINSISAFPPPANKANFKCWDTKKGVCSYRHQHLSCIGKEKQLFICRFYYCSKSFIKKHKLY